MSFPYTAIEPFSIDDLDFVDATSLGKSSEYDLYQANRSGFTTILDGMGEEWDDCFHDPNVVLLQFNFSVTRDSASYGMWSIYNARVLSDSSLTVQVSAFPGPGLQPYYTDDWQDDTFRTMRWLLLNNLHFENGSELDVAEWNFPSRLVKPDHRWDLENNPRLKASLDGEKGGAELEYEDTPDDYPNGETRTHPLKFWRR